MVSNFFCEDTYGFLDKPKHTTSIKCLKLNNFIAPMRGVIMNEIPHRTHFRAPWFKVMFQEDMFVEWVV